MKKSKIKNAAKKSNQQVNNSLGNLAGSLFPVPGAGAPVGQSDTLYYNLRWYTISNQRNLLAEMYAEWGLVQTLVDQPVDDAFRAGWQTKTSVISAEQVEELENFIQKNHVVYAIKQALKWARLYGGGAVLIITEEDPATPFNPAKLKPDSALEFRGVDCWELYPETVVQAGNMRIDPGTEYYFYYGQKVHRSRVLQVLGKEAPSPIRPRLLGWGMSELEKVVRSINQYLKNQDLVFELLDEAKIDVFKIQGLNEALSTDDSTAGVANRLQHANMIKNFLNAITMDTDDDYVQKQLSFAGLPDILKEIRIGVACDLKIPVTKLFGTSVGGLGSGEDEIENYNSMLEGEIRSKSKYIVMQVLEICCQKLFGIIPEDLMINFNPLRILSAEQEENVKEKQFRRTVEAYEKGLIPALEAKQAINKASLLPIEINEDDVALPPISMAFQPEQDEA